MLAHTLRRWAHSSITLGKKCSTSYSLHSLCSPGRSISELSPLSKFFLRGFGSLPKHDVVGLPTLSPTIEVGTIVKWNMEEGDEFGPGCDTLLALVGLTRKELSHVCFIKVETDKAIIAFEAVDDGVLAKILVPEGVSDIRVGTPIMVTVEEKEDVDAFADYKAEDNVSSTPEVTKEPKHEEDNILKQDDSSVNAAPDVQILPTPPPSTATTLPKSKPTPAVPVPHEKEGVTTTTTSNLSTSRLESIPWGENIKNGPLYHCIRQQQVAYVARYGTTGTEIIE